MTQTATTSPATCNAAAAGAVTGSSGSQRTADRWGVSGRGFVVWSAFLLALTYYFGVGAFPMGPFKGDGTSMASGARQIIEHGWDGPRIDYGRETRPGVFWMLIALRRLTGGDTYLIFSIVSLAAGVGGVLLAAAFAARFSRLPLPWCGLGILLLFPDAVTWGCYPNGTVLAGCLGLGALGLLTDNERCSKVRIVLAGVLAGLAVLARVDSILLGLVSLPLLSTKNWRATVVRVAVFGAVASVIAFGGLCASGVQVFGILQQANKVLSVARPHGEGLLMRIATDGACTSCLAFFPLLTVFLIGVGIVHCVRQRQWRVLGIVVAGIGPIVFVYGRLIYSSPLYYLIALFACLAFAGIEAVLGARRPVRIGLSLVAGLLFVVQYPVGVNVTLRAKPWFPTAEPTLIRFVEHEIPSGPLSRVSLGIGAGGVVTNSECVRFCSGLLFHPLALHTVKEQLSDAFAAMKESIRACEDVQPPLLIYSSEWATCSQVHKALQDLGYSCIARTHLGPEGVASDRFVWQRDNSTIVHMNTWEIFDPWTHPAYTADAPQRQSLLYVTGGGRERNQLLQSHRVTKAWSDRSILTSESVCAFEVSLSEAAGMPLPK